MLKFDTLKVSEIAQLEKDDVWARFNDHRKYNLEFADGVMEGVRGREILVSWYPWWLARNINKCKLITKELFLNERFRKGTMTRIYEKAAFFFINRFNLNAEVIGQELKGEMNKFKTDTEGGWGRYVTTLNADDYLAVINHPGVRDAVEELQSVDFSKHVNLLNAEHHVNKAQRKVEKILTSDDESLQGTRLYELTRSGQVDKVQVIKQVCCVGMCCDINSRIFKIPVVNSYALGMRDHYSFLIESRSSSRALAYQKSPLEAVEYANREFQILTDSLCNLHRHEDCGTTTTIPWMIEKQDLKVMNGLYYCFKPNQGGFDDYIRPTDDHLIGKTVWLRTTLTCQHADENGVCETCFGRLGMQVPNGTNLGHASIVVLGSNAAQKVLSLKHVEGSANSMKIVFPEDVQRWLYAASEESNIYINSPEKGGNLKLLIKQEYLPNIGFIETTDICRLEPSMISKVQKMTIEIIDSDGDVDTLPIDIQVAARDSYLTMHMLAYAKRKGYNRRADGHIEIDLSDWDYDFPALEVPRRQASMLDFLAEIKAEIQNRAGSDKLKEDITPSYLSAVLRQFSDLVMKQFNINLTHLATILRSTMAVDPKSKDYRIPNDIEDASFAKYRDIVFGRNIATSLSYQEITGFLYNENSFRKDNKMVHPHDAAIFGDI
tara:strand:- start:151561 stop:153546 length:1986 start_codon:yes stop_codon:yes gene_type:complete